MRPTFFILFLMFLFSPSLWAQTVINVTTTNDELNADANISLREAIEMANQGSGAYVINLVSGATYPLTLPGADDANLSGDLDVTRPDIVLTIDGNGNSSGPSATIDAAGINNPSLSLFNNAITIHGSGSATGSTITLNDLVITHGAPLTTGGGVFFNGSAATGEGLTINRCHLTLNTASIGAGLATQSVDFVTINDSTFSSNMAASVGGAVSISGGSLQLNNSTISGNSADTSGGAFYLSGTATVIRSSTIYNNDANSNGGGLTAFGGADADIKNSILSGNTATNNGPDCWFPGGLTGSVTSNGYNVIGDLGNCGFNGAQTGDQIGVNNPFLGALADNGGNTPTHSEQAGSPALDNGDPAGCKDSNGILLANDQRGPGFDRALDSDDNGSIICDSGAYEAAGTIDEQDVQVAINNLSDVISNAPVADFKNGNPQHAFMNKLTSVLNQLEDIANETDPDVKAGLINQLKSKLINDILAKSNGCPSEPDKNDWVEDCDLQLEIQDWVEDILNLLDQL